MASWGRPECASGHIYITWMNGISESYDEGLGFLFRQFTDGSDLRKNTINLAVKYNWILFNQRKRDADRLAQAAKDQAALAAARAALEAQAKELAAQAASLKEQAQIQTDLNTKLMWLDKTFSEKLLHVEDDIIEKMRMRDQLAMSLQNLTTQEQEAIANELARQAGWDQKESALLQQHQQNAQEWAMSKAQVVAQTSEINAQIQSNVEQLSSAITQQEEIERQNLEKMTNLTEAQKERLLELDIKAGIVDQNIDLSSDKLTTIDQKLALIEAREKAIATAAQARAISEAQAAQEAYNLAEAKKAAKLQWQKVAANPILSINQKAKELSAVMQEKRRQAKLAASQPVTQSVPQEQVDITSLPVDAAAITDTAAIVEQSAVIPAVQSLPVQIQEITEQPVTQETAIATMEGYYAFAGLS